MLITVKTDKITNYGNQRVVKFIDNPTLVAELENELNLRGMFIQVIPVTTPNFFWKASDFKQTTEPQQDNDITEELYNDYLAGNDTGAMCSVVDIGVFNTTKTVAGNGVSETKAAKNKAALDFIGGKVDIVWLADVILKFWKMDTLPYEDHSEDDPPYVIPEEHRRHLYVYEMKSYPVAPTTSDRPKSLLIKVGAVKGYGGSSSVFPNHKKDGWHKP